VLSLSAVESLGQNEKWTEKQTLLINQLATQAESRSHGDIEYNEVAEALRRSLYRLGLRQGVMRILASLDLQHLRKEWDRIYTARSGLFHGTCKMTEPEIGQLAIDAVTVSVHACGGFSDRSAV
jgi:hypothetical protein